MILYLRSCQVTESSDEETVPRSKPPAPTLAHRVEQDDTSWVPPDILRTADLDASDVSEFTVDAKMMAKLAREKGDGAVVSVRA